MTEIMMKSCSLARSCQFPDKPIPTKNKTDRPSAGATPWVTQTCGVFLCPAGGTQNCMKTGGKSPYFSPVGGANEAAHILSLMGGRAAIQGRKPNGQLGAIEYTILEQPRPPEPKPKKPERENPAQLNTNRSSKEKSKKDLSSTEGSNPVQSIPPTPRARTGRDGTGCGSGRAIDGMAAGPYKFNVGGLRGAAEGGHQKLPIRLVWIADISRWPLSALT